MSNSKAAHLYDLFDTKENIEFFLRCASEAGACPLSSVLSHKGRGKRTPAAGGVSRLMSMHKGKRDG
ncbi:MAG: hypothetical protein WBD64_11765 [Candidatus Zixiibacteriota bacterium]